MVISFGVFRSGLTWEQRLQNPLGFTVEGYAQHNLNSKTEGNTI